MTDSSDHVVEAVLQQYVYQCCPIAYFSKKLKSSETKYSTYDRELLEIYVAIKHFHHFLRVVRSKYLRTTSRWCMVYQHLIVILYNRSIIWIIYPNGTNS